MPGRAYSIGIAWFAPDPVVDLEIVGLLKGLAERGFVKGENLSVLAAHAQGEVANLAAIVRDFDARGLGALVPMTTPALVGALSGAKRTPVVFSGVYDPLAAGAGKSFAEHLPFVTGVSSFPDIARTVETIRRLVPNARSVGTLYNPSEPNSSKVVKVSRDLFRAASLRLEETAIASTAEAVPAVDVLVGRGVDALWVTGDNTALQAFPAIAGAATRARIPLVNNHVEFLRNGGLASVGTNFFESGYAAADPVARVLNGASPGSIPIRNVSVPELGLSLGVARALGLSFPPDLLAQARAFPGLGAWLGRPARLALAADDSASAAAAREALVKGLARALLEEGSDFVLAGWRDGTGEPEPDLLFDARAAAGGPLSAAGPTVPSLPVGPGEESASRAAVEAVRLLVDGRGSGSARSPARSPATASP